MALLDPPGELELTDLPDRAIAQVTGRLLSPDLDEWANQLSRVGNCAHPIRLVGSSQTVDARTGEVLSSYSSEQESGGVTRIACGNRRAYVCPACSRVYAADTWQLIRAGAAGGKGVPESVGRHPMVFATATAPSFGAVHTKTRSGTGRCRPRRKKSLCPHGKPAWCSQIHTAGDHLIGQPLCADCYDYNGHVVWQWHAPELWRRFTIALNRQLGRHLGLPASNLRQVASVQFAKVAEYQRRGVVHFHALIRLDGPKQPDRITPPPAGIDAAQLAELIRDALSAVELVTAPVDSADAARRIGFGAQLDARAVTTTNDDDDRQLSPAQVSGYIAKYATKTITDPDLADSRSAHYARLRDTVRNLHCRAAKADPSAENPYALLGKWDHMLGFRGHFSTKSRKYSTTLGALRHARRDWCTARTRNQERPGRVRNFVCGTA